MRSEQRAGGAPAGAAYTAWGGQARREGAQPPLSPPLPLPPLSLLLFLFPEADLPPHSLTVLSRPSVINIKKKMMAKNVDAGMLAMASAYVMKRRLGPETGGEEEPTVHSRP